MQQNQLSLNLSGRARNCLHVYMNPCTGACTGPNGEPC